MASKSVHPKGMIREVTWPPRHLGLVSPVSEQAVTCGHSVSRETQAPPDGTRYPPLHKRHAVEATSGVVVFG